MTRRRWVLGIVGAIVVAAGMVATAAATSHATDTMDGVLYWPSYYRYQQLVRSTLVDPDSAKFSGLFFHRQQGSQYLCGHINARNRMGGYNGYRWFYASMSGGVKIAADDEIADLQAVLQHCGN